MGFNPSEQTSLSNEGRQNQILQACRKVRFCECTALHLQKKITELGVKVTWSKLKLECYSLSEVRNFSQMGLRMTYDGKIGEFLSVKRAGVLPYGIKEKVEEMKEAKMEGKVYIDNDKRAFNIFHIIVTKMESKKVMTDCKSNGKKFQYFYKTGKNILRYATRLTLVGELNTEYIGTNTSPFLQIFLELRILHIISPHQY